MSHPSTSMPRDILRDFDSTQFFFFTVPFHFDSPFHCFMFFFHGKKAKKTDAFAQEARKGVNLRQELLTAAPNTHPPTLGSDGPGP